MADADIKISVIICSYNPRADFLRRTLDALKVQTLAQAQWELLLVDNASREPLAETWNLSWHPMARIICEAQPGLSFARHRGFQNVSGELVVLADDDNVLAPDYLECVVNVFSQHPKLGAAGGRSLPEFETTPPVWINEFLNLLACRNLGADSKLADGFDKDAPKAYPLCAPIGAGMAVRREALKAWLLGGITNELSDRRGNELASGGDNDIILTILESGWGAGYFHELSLTHLIPATRLEPEYLARLNHGIAKSWMQVLSKHQCSSWSPIPAWTVPLRKIKAWFTYRAWAGPVERIRWRGACGHFDGRVSNKLSPH